MDERVPIMIIGAGPVGLLLANLLGQQGLPCILVDKRRFQPDWSRSIGITPPSLAILKRAGLASAFIDRGVKVNHARVFDDRTEVGSLDFSGLHSEYPFILSLPQNETMALLSEGLLRHSSVTFCPGLEMKGLIPDGTSARVLLGWPSRPSSFGVEAEWVIGCDGHASPTRAAAGIGFSYSSYPSGFVMADHHDRTGWGSEARLFFTAQGSLESFPLPRGQRRWIASRPVGSAGTGLIETRARSICGVDLRGLASSPESEFIPERLLADTFWRNRVILAGDAAHVMSPIGGQGMNIGFADADLLASLIPLLEEPATVSRILNDYDRSRKKAFQSACAKAAAGMWIGTRTGTRASAFRSLFFRCALHSPTVSERLSRHFAMIGDSAP